MIGQTKIVHAIVLNTVAPRTSTQKILMLCVSVTVNFTAVMNRVIRGEQILKIAHVTHKKSAAIYLLISTIFIPTISSVTAIL